MQNTTFEKWRLGELIETTDAHWGRGGRRGAPHVPLKRL